ncbi:MAG TPA: hypothetical protein VNZ53_45715 [Steroidobacteraceae bacterium]|nr:hypothetical protein [Steroidobacteraceae bacterium]
MLLQELTQPFGSENTGVGSKILQQRRYGCQSLRGKVDNLSDITVNASRYGQTAADRSRSQFSGDLK